MPGKFSIGDLVVLDLKEISDDNDFARYMKDKYCENCLLVTELSTTDDPRDIRILNMVTGRLFYSSDVHFKKAYE